MHGRLKVKTTKEQEEEKRQKRAQKVKQYRAAYGRIVEKRNADEKDEEGLQITQQILEMIPDIHSLWNYRREILEHFRQTESTDERQRRLESERYLTETCLRANPKSYCAWHHRTWIMDAMPAPDWTRELALCTKFLSLDERNFHCWDYRRFVVRRANVPAEKELAFTDEKIAVNFSNYSCWHYRSKLLPLVDPDPLGVRPVREDRHRSELELVQSAAFTDPTDQSAWFYQRWLLGRARPRQAVSRALLSANLSFVALALPARSALELQFVVGSKPVDGTWASADGRDSSSVWVFAPRVPLAVPLEGPVLVRPSSGDVEEAALRTAADGRSACLITQPDFGAHFSPGLASVLQDELFALQQLLEFDPDSKWTLLTSVLLMQTIDRHAYHADSLRTLDELVELDYLRANYYKDLKSRLVVEHALEQQRGDEVNLSGLSLTTLYHAELLSLARSVDLSGNRLARVMPNLSSLQCCETLSLDDNDLASLSGWARMPSLRSLSLRNNSLEDVSSLTSLTACPALRSLDLRGCPLARAAPDDLKQAVLEVLPDIDTLNGERL